MSETEIAESHETPRQSIREKLQIQNKDAVLKTILVALIGALLYLVHEMVPMPYLAISIVTLGLVPSLAIIAIIGAIRNGEIVALTLYGLAIGVLGLITGFGTYDFTKGRSLAKLSILSAVGVTFTALLTAVVGIFVEGVATLVVIAFQILPILTLGLPSVILLTPLVARIWYWIVENYIQPAEE